MGHIYNNEFFDYIDSSARNSARHLIRTVQPWLEAKSVVDMGSGRGVWLAQWRDAGVQDVLAIDGDYVDRSTLAVPAEQFLAADLTRPIHLKRKFDLAQSLEVGEHLPEAAAETLVDSLTSSADRVLFSAAVNGQGGECHINEKPLSFWQDLFAERGFRAFDCVRPHLAKEREVAPWYRYNTVLYANPQGSATLPEDVLRTALTNGQPLADGGDPLWRLRKTVVRALPRETVTWIAQRRASILARQARANA